MERRGELHQDDDAQSFDVPAEFWESARPAVPKARKQPVQLRIDPDVVSWFKDQGQGYQTRMNAVLRSYMDAEKRSGRG